MTSNFFWIHPTYKTTRTFFPFYEEENDVVVKYYTFNGQRIAVNRGGALSYLHTDHLSSNSVSTNASGVETARRTYYAYGKERPGGSIPLPTDRTYTGQEQDTTGLMFYHARFYDPALGTFISPDTMVPSLGTVIDYNRFAYSRANPLRYSDPSGHAPQSADDDENNPAACATDWCWKNRWYRAHGYKWQDGNWSLSEEVADSIAHFYDDGILNDVLGEAGILVAAGGWNSGELGLLGQGVVALANRIGSMGRLKEMIGGTSFSRKTDGKNDCAGMGACSFGFDVEFYTALFNGSAAYIRGSAVHELAHIIDYRFGLTGKSDPAKPSNSFSQGPHISNYATKNSREYWAEGVVDWVYGGQYRSVAGSSDGYQSGVREALNSDQTDWITRVLKGWGW